jgi:hypothetical protein
MDFACFISCHYQKHLNVVIVMSNAMASDASLLRFFLSSHVTCKKGELDGRAIFTPVLRAIDMQPQSIFSATGAQKKSRSMVMKTSVKMLRSAPGQAIQSLRPRNTCRKKRRTKPINFLL